MGENLPARWESLVFITPAGTPIRHENLRRWLDKLTEEAGIERRVSPKDWRTTATSLISDSGLSLERRMDLLGHKDGRTLLTHYRKPTRPSVDTAVAFWGSPEVATKVAKHSIEGNRRGRA